VVAVAAVVAAVAAGGCGASAPGRSPGPPTRDPAVVDVSVARGTGPADGATGIGAGGGRVVTVAHVLDGGGRVTVRSGGGVTRAARVLAVDRRDDLAVLLVPGLRARAARFAGGSAVARLLVLRDGRGSLRPASARRAIAASVEGSGAPPGYRRPSLELAADVAAGDSGAPVLARDGSVVGIVFATARDRDGVAYAVDGAMVGRLLRGLGYALQRTPGSPKRTNTAQRPAGRPTGPM
jgi:S1-C subfamily serine protease